MSLFLRMVDVDFLVQQTIQHHQNSQAEQLGNDIESISKHFRSFVNSDSFCKLSPDLLIQILKNITIRPDRSNLMFALIQKIVANYPTEEIPKIISTTLFNFELTDEDMCLELMKLLTMFPLFESLKHFYSLFQGYYKNHSMELLKNKRAEKQLKICEEELNQRQQLIEELQKQIKAKDLLIASSKEDQSFLKIEVPQNKSTKLAQERRKSKYYQNLSESLQSALFPTFHRPLTSNIAAPIRLSSIDTQDIFSAIDNDKIDVIKSMCEKGGWCEQEQARGCTAVYYSIRQGKLEIAEILIKGGADITTRIGDETPYMLAKKEGYDSIVKLLREQGVTY